MRLLPEAADSPSASTVQSRLDARRVEQTGRRRRKRRLAVLLGGVVLLSPALYSYTSTILLPSSLPLGVRSVEWLRNHHGNWLVAGAERIYYTWNKPNKRGPQLKALPAVGLAPVAIGP